MSRRSGGAALPRAEGGGRGPAGVGGLSGASGHGRGAMSLEACAMGHVFEDMPRGTGQPGAGQAAEVVRSVLLASLHSATSPLPWLAWSTSTK